MTRECEQARAEGWEVDQPGYFWPWNGLNSNIFI